VKKRDFFSALVFIYGMIVELVLLMILKPGAS